MQWASSTATTASLLENSDACKTPLHGGFTTTSGDIKTILLAKHKHTKSELCFLYPYKYIYSSKQSLPTKTVLPTANSITKSSICMLPYPNSTDTNIMKNLHLVRGLLTNFTYGRYLLLLKGVYLLFHQSM